MGDISAVVFLNNLTQLLAQENDLAGLEDQVRWLYNQFELCPRFKKYGETKAALHPYDEEEHRFETYDKERRFETDYKETRYGWFLIQKIRRLADEAEKVVDTYYCNVAAKQRTNSKAEKPSARDCSSDHSAKLCTLRMSVEEITRRADKYRWMLFRRMDAVELSKQGRSPTPRGWAAEEHEVVGFTKECNVLVDRLINEPRRELDVKAIVGGGGTGKSILALKVYNDDKVQHHFSCRGWVSVSQKYRLKNLLLRILRDVSVTAEDIYEMDEWELKRLLFKQLKDRRYLIVIDDLWSAKAWEELKEVFPDDNLGSRIMVTTRRLQVASSATGNDSFIHGRSLQRMSNPANNRDPFSSVVLRSLDIDEAWELFERKIKSNQGFRIYEAEGIVHAYCRIPIVIVVLAGTLGAIDMTYSRFDNFVRQFKEVKKYRSPERKDVLTICYGDIPNPLKACFLYVGVFPEDFEISVKQLIQLWIAEGFVQHSEENTDSSLEDVAEVYLEELINRNLVQVSKRRSDGGPKSCRIHDLLREFCIDFSPWHEKFLSVYPRKDDDSFPENPRRLSILSDCPEYMWNPDINSDTNHVTNSDTCNASHVLRSLSCFSQDNQSILEENWKSIFRRFPLFKGVFG